MDEIQQDIEKCRVAFETTTGWSERVELMDALRTRLESIKFTEKDQVVEEFLTLSDGIIHQLADIRSCVAKSASSLIISMSLVAGSAFEPMANMVLPQLLNLSVVTIGVMSKAGVDCIESIMRNSRVDITYLFKACTSSKNMSTRLCSITAIIIALESWTKAEITDWLSDAIAVIAFTIHDACPNVRSQGRKALIHLSNAIPGIESRLAQVPEPIMRKIFLTEYPDHSVTKAMEQPRVRRKSLLKHHMELKKSKQVLKNGSSSSEVSSAGLILAPLRTDVDDTSSIFLIG